MKILVLCYEYPPIGGGGGRVAQSIAEQMAARGHEVRVQTAALGWRSTQEMIGGVTVHRTASGRRAPDTCRVPEMASYCATSFFPTLEHLRSWKPDVIHAHFAVPTGFLAWAVGHLTGVPYVLTAHLGDVPGGVPEQTDTLFQLIGPVARWVWNGAAAATAVSSFVQQLAERAYGRPVERILNGISLDDTPSKSAPGPVPRHLLFLGRLNPQKNPVFLIDALARLKNLPWKLTLIGDGPLMNAVRDRIAATGLGERVELTGWLNSREVHHILAQADILCMPSLSEGLPVAAIEALKYGLAIVTSEIPGVQDVVDDQFNGFRVPLGDTSAFADRLRSLIEDDVLLATMQEASAKKVQDFDLVKVADQYEQVLEAAARHHQA